MDDLFKSPGAFRTTCRECGKAIDPKAPAVQGLCSACSGRIADTMTTGVAASTIVPVQSEVRTFNRAPRARAALAELVARGRGPEIPIDGAIPKAGKTLISLVALIPVVGIFLIHRSLVHTAAEKYRLACMSIAVTGFVVTWLILQLPKPAEFDPGLRTRLESEL